VENGRWIVLEPDGKPGQLVLDIVCEDAEKLVSWKPASKGRTRMTNSEVFQNVEGFAISNYPQVTPEKIHDFYETLQRRGMGSVYEGTMAKLIIEHLQARHKRQEKLAEGSLDIPEIPGTPKALEKDISAAFVKQAAFLTGGLLDHLTGRSYWKDPVDPVVFSIAKETGLIIDER
jgi:hypothetical protein